VHILRLSHRYGNSDRSGHLTGAYPEHELLVMFQPERPAAVR
jgi:hypothetical protein